MRKGRHLRSDSRPPFSLGTEIAVRTTTNRCRLNRVQPGAIVVRKSLKSTGRLPRRHTSFTNLPFAIHLYRPGFGAKTFFFTHQLEFVRHLHARRHASGSARQKRVRPKKARTSDYSFSLTNGLSQPRGRLLRTQKLLVGGKRENGCQRFVVGFSRRPFHIFRRWRCTSRYSKGALLQPQPSCSASLEHSGSELIRGRSSRAGGCDGNPLQNPPCRA